MQTVEVSTKDISIVFFKITVGDSYVSDETLRVPHPTKHSSKAFLLLY